MPVVHSYWISVGHMNYYSKSTFIMTLIEQEKLVFILVILYIREYLCVFTKINYRFQFRVSGYQNY